MKGYVKNGIAPVTYMLGWVCLFFLVFLVFSECGFPATIDKGEIFSSTETQTRMF
jgi:hypothetical protein